MGFIGDRFEETDEFGKEESLICNRFELDFVFCCCSL